MSRVVVFGIGCSLMLVGGRAWNDFSPIVGTLVWAVGMCCAAFCDNIGE